MKKGVASMQLDVNMQSPLFNVQVLLEEAAGKAPEKFLLRELPFRALHNVRADLGDANVARVLGNSFNLQFPVQPNTVAENDRHVIWWLGPDEWLAQSVGPVDMPAPVDEIQALLAGSFARVLDVSSGYTLLHLSGSMVTDVLNKGCPLDFDTSVFGKGQCAQSHFFKSDIAVRPVSDGWHLLVRRSFAEYTVKMLLDAAYDYYLLS
ncbi:sarcosine oxidase subunit gamma [Advenella sp. RU8]|uniref:sarcosine oxidase subunit gamma n=1 Tax=Advenella sp. RU8 TaxID=3399575 RepID=UPI003AAE02B8